ncbi:MAG: CBS domain-containing protein [Bdellovibrionales bacterium]|nr:CBS domain-containing protein [Bdellovibrionales bacterium]
MKEIPQIQEVMTPSPHTVGYDRPLSEARRLMRDYSIRHLPVVRGDNLIGMLSDRDLKLAEAMESAYQKSTGLSVLVEDVCSHGAYQVAPTESLAHVVISMAREGVGSAVIVDAGEVVGIFTTMDACRCFADFLEAGNLY